MTTERFSVTLAKLIDGHWLPVRVIQDQPERIEIEFRNWHRFSAGSELQFEDPEGPAR